MIAAGARGARCAWEAKVRCRTSRGSPDAAGTSLAPKRSWQTLPRRPFMAPAAPPGKPRCMVFEGLRCLKVYDIRVSPAAGGEIFFSLLLVVGRGATLRAALARRSCSVSVVAQCRARTARVKSQTTFQSSLEDFFYHSKNMSPFSVEHYQKYTVRLNPGCSLVHRVKPLSVPSGIGSVVKPSVDGSETLTLS